MYLILPLAVTLIWNANPESNIVGYKLYYGTAPQVYPLVVDVGNVLRTQVTNLLPCVTYYFALTAYNTNESTATNFESDFSAELPWLEPTNGVGVVTNRWLTNFVEAGASPSGPWTNHVIFVTPVPTNQSLFFRVRLEMSK